MEHIYSCSGEASELQFPCLVNEQDTISCRKCDWREYPKARDVDFEDIQYHQWQKYPAKVLATFLQDWLFFGLLRTILPKEIDVRVKDFVRTNDRRERYITMSKLRHNYLEPWENYLGKLPKDEMEALRKQNQRVLKEASKLCYHLSELPTAPGLHLCPPLPLECVLPCALLGHALSDANASNSIVDSSNLVWTTGELIAEQMELQGWCPFIVCGIENAHEMTTRCYFTTLGGPKQKLARNHARCTDTRCYPTDIKDAQHATLDCACATLSAPVTVMVQAIRDRTTPLLRHEPATSVAPSSLAVGLSNSNFPYVAISHVWCDGLGNPKGNEIHECQAGRLQHAVDHIFQGKKSRTQGNGGGWWWLDTLCVPAEKAYQKEQALAIQQMKKIYAHADSVLIIDSGLDACDNNTSALEVLARLRLSNWIRRLWTFQEGQFAKSIYILVGSTPRLWEELTKVANQLPREGYQRRIAKDLIKAYSTLFFPRIMEEAFLDEPESLDPEVGKINLEVGEVSGDSPFITERVLSDLFLQLSNRVATNIRDEPQCLSLLLNLNTKYVQDAVKEEDRGEKERRRAKELNNGAAGAGKKTSSDSTSSGSNPSEAGMVMVLRLVNQAAKLMPENLRPRGCFPPSMIFSCGRRLLMSGFRWAPQSYLYSGALKNFSSPLPLEVRDPRLGKTCERPSGVLCERGHGLRVMYPGLIITKVDSVRPIAEHFIVDSSDERIEGMPRFWRCKFSKDVQGGGGSWDDIAPTNSDSCDDVETCKLAIVVDGFSILDSSLATILVKVTGKCPEGGYTVERLGRLVGSATPEDDNHEWVRDPWHRVKGRWLPLSQMWCVD